MRKMFFLALILPAAGALGADSCPSGYYKVGDITTATSCPSGYYKVADVFDGTSCPAGYYKIGDLQGSISDVGNDGKGIYGYSCTIQ